MSLKKIISGGQTGADIAGIDAAIVSGLSYGGWLPKGRKTEYGPLDLRYTNMTEMPVGGYQEMTEQNVKDSDGTVIFTHGKYTGVSALTSNYAIKHDKPVLHLDLDVVGELTAIESLIEWIYKHNIATLNVAGSRESKDEHIYDDVHSIIKSILNTLKTAEVVGSPQTPPDNEPSLLQPVIATPQVVTREVATIKAEEQESRASGFSTLIEGWATVIKKKLIEDWGKRIQKKFIEGWAKIKQKKPIERWPKIRQKNYIYIALGILILTIVLMVIPGRFKKYSSQNALTKSSSLSDNRDPKTTGVLSDSSHAVGKTPEPQDTSAVQTTTNSAENAAIQTPSSDSKTPMDSQAKSPENTPDISTDTASPGGDQLTTKENEPVQSLSDTSKATEKTATHQVPPKKNLSKNRNRCGSLYKKIADGEVLKKGEAKFLADHCK